MATAKRFERWRSCNIMLLILTVGLVWPASSEVSWARAKKDAIYNECACRCVAPGDIVGDIAHFHNDAGLSCGAYLGKTCNYTNQQTGGVSTGTLKNCGGYKPGGTKALQQAIPKTNTPIMRRGVDPAPPTSSPTIQDETAKTGDVGAVTERAVKQPPPRPKPNPQPGPIDTPTGPGTPPTFPK